jgi:hypothetical protein
MSNIKKFSENILDIDKNEEEKDELRFNTIESIKGERECDFIPGYNIEKERYESINFGICKNNVKTDKTNTILNNSLLYSEENINQSVSFPFQDLPLNDNWCLNHPNINSEMRYYQSQLQKNNHINCNDFINTKPYLQVEETGEKKDGYKIFYNFFNFIDIKLK